MLRPRRILLFLCCIAAISSACIWAFTQPGSLSAVRQSVLALNTLRVGLSVGLLATPIGFFLALIWLKTDVPFRRAGLLILLTLMFIPLYVQASAWQAGFSEIGWYRIAGQVTDPPLFNDWRAAIWIHVASATAWATLIIGLGLVNSSRDCEEAAMMETGTWPLTCWIIIPQALPWIVVAAIWIAIMSAEEMVVVDLFRIDTYARHLYQSLAQETSLTEAFRINLVPSLVSIGLIGLAFWMATRSVPGGMSDWYVAPLHFRLGAARAFLFAAFILLITCLAFVPAASLIYQAGLKQAQPGEFHWSLSAMRTALRNGLFEFRDELQWSFLIGALAATLSLLGAIFATSMSRSIRWLRPFPWLVAAIVVSIPAPLVGLWLIPVMNQPDWPWLYRLHNETVFSPVLAAAIRSWPVLFVLCWFAARDISRDVSDLSAIDGAGALRRLISVSAPLLWRAWFLCWLVGFALATGELAATLMVIPPGAATVATRVYGLIHSGVREKEAALCLLHTAIGAGLALLALHLHKRRAAMLGPPSPRGVARA